MTTPRDHAELIERYLDGALTPDEATAFVESLRQDPTLRADMELATRVNASLRRVFEPSRAVSPSPIVRKAPMTSARVPTWLAAAMLILTFGGAIYLVGAYMTNSGPFSPPGRVLPPAEFTYRHFEKTGFTPAWVCDTDEQFAKAVVDQLGSPLLVRVDDAPHLSIIGWAYQPYGTKPIISGRTMVLLAKHDGREIMVLIDHSDATRCMPRVMPGGGLHVFERAMGDLTAYEVTPLPEPVVIPRLYVPGQ